LKIIPVLDVLDGIAVHAVAGERQGYKPLKSVLCRSDQPLEIASYFRNLGFTELYLADLDAICKARPNIELIEKIAKTTGLQLMVDAGANNLQRINTLLEARVSKVVIGTETLTSTNFVEKAFRIFGSDSVIISLDVKNREFFGNNNFGELSKPLELVKEFKKMGAVQLIVLDLARVGSGYGVDFPFFRKVLEVADLKVFAGGGVRSLADLRELDSIGIKGVLLASALHNGKIAINELKRTGVEL